MPVKSAAGVNTMSPSPLSTAVPCVAGTETEPAFTDSVSPSASVSLATTSIVTAVSSVVLAVSSTATGASFTASTATVTVPVSSPPLPSSTT